jgi:stage V sporulation protein G
VEITEVRIKLMEDAGERLQGFCSITFDHCFVVRDLKIIEGLTGPFVAMPSRKLTAHCPGCGCKNHLRAAYCNQCGQRLKDDRVAKDDDGRAKLYADIAHPINSVCRELIQEAVIRAFREEVERSKLPGYVPSYDDFDDIELEQRPARRPKLAAVRETAACEKTHVEPAQTVPRAPHTAPIQPAVQNANKQNAFGAGIW